MRQHGWIRFVCNSAIGIALLFCAVPEYTLAGAYIGTNDDGFFNSITYPIGYSGTESSAAARVCIVPGTEFANAMAGPVKNAIATWNRLQSTSGNLRSHALPSGTYDMESVMVHELGHCIGLAHPNLGNLVAGANSDYTMGNAGPDEQFNVAAGVDGVIGSADDVRGDDINLHWFYQGLNNPFVELPVVDSTSYTTDLAELPVADLFAANADRFVSADARYRSASSEAVMQNGTLNDEVQRTLNHDDVSMVRFAMSGLDQQQGSADDFSLELSYGGISDQDCDITVEMDSARTGFANCRMSLSIPNGSSNLFMQSGRIAFNTDIDWYFNNTPPCNESLDLQPGEWKMFSLPCQVGISTSAALRDVIGDDLGTDNYNVDWAMFSFDYEMQPGDLYAASYQLVGLDDELSNGKGYWLITNETGKSVDVVGEYSAETDTALFINTGNGSNFGWNLAGTPFRQDALWSESLVVNEGGVIMSLAEADPEVSGTEVIPGVPGTECTNSPGSSASCVVARYAYAYDSALEKYNLLSTATSVVQPFDAIWVLSGSAGNRLRLKMSASERVTP